MFAFFRRRQKMVVIVMVVLMVSFLVGFKGLSMLTSRDPAKRTVGRFADGSKLRATDLRIAQSDLQILGMTGVGAQFLAGLNSNGDLPTAQLSYAMLTHESEPFGPVRDSQVDALLASSGLVDEKYTELLVFLRTNDIDESQFRSAARRLVRNIEAYGQGASVAPPSLPELKYWYNMFEERVVLNYFTLPADDFLSQARAAETFTDEEIAAQFETHRDVVPGVFTESNPFGFGYRVPVKVDVEYLAVRFGPLLNVLTPTDEEVYAYYDENLDKMIREVQTDEMDADGNPVMTTETVSRGEARPIIHQMMLLETLGKASDTMLVQADAFVKDARDANVPMDGPIYDAAIASMTLPADAVLAISLEDFEIRDETLPDAMKLLSMKAGIKGISFPTVDANGEPFGPDKTVSLSNGSMTVGEALAKIASQVGLSDLQWVQCSAFVGSDAVLFTAGDHGTFPLFAGKTGLVDRRTLAADPVAGRMGVIDSARGTGLLLAQLAFDREFFPTDEQMGDLEAFDEALPETLASHFYRRLRLNVLGDPMGMVMWQVVDAQRSEVAETMSDAAREAVIADLRTLDAMKLAQAKADELLGSMKDQSFGQVAELGGYATTMTPPMARMERTLYGMNLTTVPGLTLPTVPARKAFFDAVFAIAQPDVEEQLTGQRSTKTGSVQLPAQRAVCLVDVVSHQLPSDAKFVAEGEFQMRMMVGMSHRAQALQVWMNHESVAERTGFVTSD
jgi:hypothetical protein